MKLHFEPDLDYHDPDDAPLILRNTGMWALYVLDWVAPWETPP
jgi:hypothetical protein